MKKLLLMLMIAASAAMVPAQPVSAQECTRGYMQCLNDTWDLTGIFQIMADIECFAGYLKCVAGG